MEKNWQHISNLAWEKKNFIHMATQSSVRNEIETEIAGVYWLKIKPNLLTWTSAYPENAK